MPFHFPGQTDFYQGKVRDVYFLKDERLITIVSDRISAFDRVLPKNISFKGQILNQIAAFMLRLTSDICPNWLEATPAPNVSVGKTCLPYKIEMVVRATLSGHALRNYAQGIRTISVVLMPEGLAENDFLPQPIVTPTTKAAKGHDEDISREEILKHRLVPEDEYDRLEQYALALFARGADYAASRGLILADAKYEFGKADGNILLIDEVHTPDCARYFIADDFEATKKHNSKPRQLSKEFVREWLIAHGFSGLEGQAIPELTDEWADNVSKRYIELYETLLGIAFSPETLTEEETERRILKHLRS